MGLQVVRGPGVGGPGGREVEQPLGGSCGGRVLAELDVGVGEHRVPRRTAGAISVARRPNCRAAVNSWRALASVPEPATAS
ncbi:hypothetical protein [Streptomyces umbrinus]|uniref:hypothetical protein n=1 Tax=Streptomyces umbrinus TaxID=67370 RepID=UPI0033E554FD